MISIREIDHVVLRVRDIDAMRGHGVAVGEIRRRYGAEGNGISIYVSDPEGNTVELRGPSDGQPPPA